MLFQKIVVSDRTGSHDGLAFVAIEHYGQHITGALNGEGQLLASLHGCPEDRKLLVTGMLAPANPARWRIAGLDFQQRWIATNVGSLPVAGCKFERTSRTPFPIPTENWLGRPFDILGVGEGYAAEREPVIEVDAMAIPEEALFLEDGQAGSFTGVQSKP